MAPIFLRLLESLWSFIDYVDFSCAPDKGAVSGEQTNRSGSKDSNRIAQLYIGEFSRMPSRREDIGQQNKIVLKFVAGLPGSFKALKSA